MNRRGFTIVELIIVLTIMGILFLLGVVNLNSSRVQGRDDERKGDIAALAAHLEAYHLSGNGTAGQYNRYPPTTLIGQEDTFLRDLDEKSVKAPDATDPSETMVAATNNTQTTAGVTPAPTIQQYVYQPLLADGSLCTLISQECRKFNLYYRLEADNTIYMVTSKNQ